MSSTTGIRKTRSSSITSTPPLLSSTPNELNLLDNLPQNLDSFEQFENVYNQCYQLTNHRSSLIDILCNILTKHSSNLDPKISIFIFNSLKQNHEYLTEAEFKQNLLPFIKEKFSITDNDLILSILDFFIEFIPTKSTILTITLNEWLAIFLHFIVTHISATSYSIYGDVIIDLLTKIVQNFTPLPKEIVDVLGRSPSSIISTNFLTQLKSWVKHVDDTKLALFSIHLWEPLAALLSRLLTRGHTKGNEMLAVIQDAFTVANYSIRGAAFSAWASFMSHIYQYDINPNQDQQLYNRLLKLFLTPFLPDYTSKSKSASIAKCRAWLILVHAYPTHVHDVILPFFSFAYGKIFNATTTTWWIECKNLANQCLYELLNDNKTGQFIVKDGGDEILNYLFDAVYDDLLEPSSSSMNWLTSWNSYLIYLIQIFTSNSMIMNDDKRIAINTCLLTRIEQFWIDSRISTEELLKLFNTFEQTNFPLAIETVLRDSSVRTKTLSATQINRSQDKTSSSSISRTTLSDQYLHMLLEHSIRFNPNDPTIENGYLHIISYLIDTLSKTSDDNFCYQTSSLLIKCSDEYTLQPLTIPSLFWHIWLRCSTYLINILNRTRTVQLDNQREDITIELLLRPFAFTDSQRLDYSYTLIWIQLFKALCRLVVLDDKHLIHIYNELLRNGLVFEQSILDQHNQRLFGFLLNIIKCLLKNFSDLDLSTIPKRSVSSLTLCYTQLSKIINTILERLLINDENYTQWVLVCYCLSKSHNKNTSNEQSKSMVFTYTRDLIVDLFTICKTSSQLEIILTNLTQIIPFLNAYEQIMNSSVDSSTTKQQQQTDNVLLNKILSILHTVFESSHGLAILQLIHPLLIIGFQHNKTAIRNKTRKCWNETFGRLTFLTYPNELRLCLRELKDKEHLLLPCFLADHDNSNTAGSGIIPSSTDESQLSQQIDIVTPLINPCRSSPGRFSSPCLPPVRSINNDKTESVFVPITNNINHENQSDDSPVVIGKRIPSISSGLTEKQKEKFRTRQVIPLICDDNSNTQSLSYTMDTPTIESMMATYQLRSASAGNKQPSSSPSNGNSLSLFKQSDSDPPPSSSSSSQENNNNNTAVESSSPPSTTATAENENTSEQVQLNDTNSNNTEDDIPEESSISKKLRRSRRPSTSARKSLTNNTRKKRSIPSTDDLTATVPSIAIEPTPSSSTTSTSTTTTATTPVEITKIRPLKSILKRLSPTKPRQDHTRHVAFHDQVKVLLFASPLRRDRNSQLQKKKSPNKDENKIPASSSSSMITRRSSALHQINNDNKSSSKILNLSELSLNSNETESTPAVPIFPALVDCDKPLDSLIHVVYGGVCPTNAINYFRSIKMNTVGDIARSTAAQIEVYPLPPPKLANIQKALSLYQERLINSPSLSPIIGTNGESLTPVASTSEEPIGISDGTFTKEAPSLPPPTASTNDDPQSSLYDVDTLIDSLDYERLYLNDNKDDENESAPESTSQIDFIRQRRELALANRDEQISPQKRRLSSLNQDTDNTDITNNEQDEQISPKKSAIINHKTLGDYLQKASEIFQTTGRLPFDDDYIELVRLLFNNPSLTHLEQLHLKSLFLDN